MGAVDCNRSFDFAILQRKSQTVTFVVISFAELGQLARHLALEGKAESGKPAVIASVEFDDSSDGARHVAFVDCGMHDEVRNGPDEPVEKSACESSGFSPCARSPRIFRHAVPCR